MQHKFKKMTLLSMVVSSTMMLSACSNGLNFSRQDPSNQVTMIPSVSSVKVDIFEIGKLATFTITGTNLSKDIKLSVPNCQGLVQKSFSPTNIVYQCTPMFINGQMISVLDNKGKTIFKQHISINQPTTPTAPQNTKISDVVFDSDLMEGKLVKFTVTGNNFHDKMTISFEGCDNLTLIEQTSEKMLLSCLPRFSGQKTLKIIDNNKEIFNKSYKVAEIVLPKPEFVVENVQFLPTVKILDKSTLAPIAEQPMFFTAPANSGLVKGHIFIFENKPYKVQGVFVNPDNSLAISTTTAMLDEVYQSLDIEATIPMLMYDDKNNPVYIPYQGEVTSSLQAGLVRKSNTSNTPTNYLDRFSCFIPQAVRTSELETNEDKNENKTVVGYEVNINCSLGQLLGAEDFDYISLSGTVALEGEQKFFKKIGEKTEYTVQNGKFSTDISLSMNANSIKPEDVENSNSQFVKSLKKACDNLSKTVQAKCEVKVDKGELSVSVKRPFLRKIYFITIPSVPPVTVPIYVNVGLALDLKFKVSAGIVKLEYTKEFYNHTGYQNGRKLDEKMTYSKEDVYPQVSFGDSEFTGEAEVFLAGFANMGAGVENLISFVETETKLGGYAQGESTASIGKNFCLSAEAGLRAQLDATFLKSVWWDGFDYQLWQDNLKLWGASYPDNCDKNYKENNILLDYVINGQRYYKYDKEKSTADTDVYLMDSYLTVNNKGTLSIDLTHVRLRQDESKKIEFEVQNLGAPKTMIPRYIQGVQPASGKTGTTKLEFDMKGTMPTDVLKFRLNAWVAGDKQNTLVSKVIEIHTDKYVVANPVMTKEYDKLCWRHHKSYSETIECNAWRISPKLAGDMSGLAGWFVEFSDGNKMVFDSDVYKTPNTVVHSPVKNLITPVKIGLVSKASFNGSIADSPAQYYDIKTDFNPQYDNITVSPTDGVVKERLYIKVEGRSLPTDIPLVVKGCDMVIDDTTKLGKNEIRNSSLYRYYLCVPTTAVKDGFATVKNASVISNIYQVTNPNNTQATLTISNPNPSVGDKVVLTLTNLANSIKSVIWNIGGAISNVIDNLANGVEHRFDKAGDVDISATLKDDKNQTVQELTSKVTVASVAVPTVSIKPDKPKQGQDFIAVLNNDGNKEKVVKAVWEYDGKTKTIAQADLYKDVPINSNKDELLLKISFYDIHNNLLGITQKSVKLDKQAVQPTIPPVTTTKLTATGITLCGDYSRNNIACNSLSSAWLGLMQDGEVQAGQKMSYTVLNQNGAECVRDNVTGLIWEQKTDDGSLRDKDNQYTWYNPDNRTNGGTIGSENGGKNTYQYIQELNAMNYCGYNDWRLPTKNELRSIVDYGRYNPAINLIFSNTQSGYYWSSSPYANNSYDAWGVPFYYGSDNYNGKSNSSYVRAVRSN